MVEGDVDMVAMIPHKPPRPSVISSTKRRYKHDNVGGGGGYIAGRTPPRRSTPHAPYRSRSVGRSLSVDRSFDLDYDLDDTGSISSGLWKAGALSTSHTSNGPSLKQVYADLEADVDHTLLNYSSPLRRSFASGKPVRRGTGLRYLDSSFATARDLENRDETRSLSYIDSVSRHSPAVRTFARSAYTPPPPAPVVRRDYHSPVTIHPPGGPRQLARRGSLDSHMTRIDMGLSGGELDLYRGPSTVKRYTPPVTRPPTGRSVMLSTAPQDGQPLYDVDMYWVGKQDLMDEHAITRKFAPIRNRISELSPGGALAAYGGGSQNIVPNAKEYILGRENPGVIPRFSHDMVPYGISPAQRSRPGGPILIQAEGQNPALVSDLEPRRKDGVVCVMVGSLLWIT